jgi:hypothetical protein
VRHEADIEVENLIRSSTRRKKLAVNQVPVNRLACASHEADINIEVENEAEIQSYLITFLKKNRVAYIALLWH